MQGLDSIVVPVFLLLISISIIVGIFAACRELLCWYMKTNERLELEKKRNEQLDNIAHYLKVLIEVEVAKKKERDENKNFELSGDASPTHKP